ncbi:MAG: 4Fe-4S binding protein [Pirellulales bacterium]
MAEEKQPLNRRNFLGGTVRDLCLVSLGGAAGFLINRGQAQGYVWQIDPTKCTACGNCASYCVLETSAVKCINIYEICGYCDLCTGYFEPEPNGLNTGAENQLCPTGAIVRKRVEGRYFEYKIDEAKCIACAKCVKGCTLFGNGSFHLQVRHDRCLNCNECSIATACPSGAFRRVAADQPAILKGREHRA